jgi:RimJ/RimL family protein N-acetyltransferase
VQIGRDEKLKRITAVIMVDNREMQHVSQKVGFKVQYDQDGHDFIAEYIL